MLGLGLAAMLAGWGLRVRRGSTASASLPAAAGCRARAQWRARRRLARAGELPALAAVGGDAGFLLFALRPAWFWLLPVFVTKSATRTLIPFFGSCVLPAAVHRASRCAAAALGPAARPCTACSNWRTASLDLDHRPADGGGAAWIAWRWQPKRAGHSSARRLRIAFWWFSRDVLAASTPCCSPSAAMVWGVRRLRHRHRSLRGAGDRDGDARHARPLGGRLMAR